MKTTVVAAVTALLCFVIGTAWVLADASMFVQYFYSARMVALTHTFTLGWVSLMIIGVLRQLGPIAFGLQLRRPSLIGGAVAVWIPGLIAMIFGFATSLYPIAAVGTALLLISVITVVSVFVVGFRGIRREMPHDHLLAGLLYFAAAAILGAWMGLSKGFDLPMPAAFHAVLFAHIHLAGAGWAGMMVFAVLSRLFPQPHLRQPLQARLRFIAFNVGLIGLTVALLLDTAWFRVFAGMLALSCIWYAAAFIPVLREFELPSDRSTAFLVSAWACFAVVAGIGLWLSTGMWEATPLRMQLQFVYGFVYMFGWLSLMIFGMLYRIVPTHLSKFIAARGVTPAVRIRDTFIKTQVQTVTWGCLTAGLFISSVAIVSRNASIFRIGWILWTCGVSIFIWGIVRTGIRVRGILRTPRAA